jgi:RNA polymerase sigma factor (sigma-70 family)
MAGSPTLEFSAETLKTTTVFVVDDDPEVRESLRLLMRSVGLNVETFGNARDFLEEFDAGRPGCLVLDVRMPGMSGLELQEKLHEMHSSLPIIIITGYGEVPMVVRAMQAGALDFISKPYYPSALLERIQQALEKDLAYHAQRSTRTRVRALLETLSPREMQVSDLLVDGKSTKEIAAKLGISPKTVDNHRAKLLEKMQVENPVELRKLLYP